jgi:choline dehydrogenase-like flavoprotein
MHDKVDVLIIGSGASGAAVAWSLADTKMRILCLEQGDWVKPSDYPSNGRDWEARLFSDFAINPNRRARPTDYPINDANSPIKVVNFNGVGGSTIMYTAHFPRLHPSDFKVRTLDGVADDWPIDYATLEPYFAENDRMMGVSGLAGDPAYPPKQPPMPPLPLGKSGTRFGKAMNELGWHWWPSDTTIATTDYEGAGAASISVTARRVARRAPRPRPTSPIGRLRSAPASNCARCAGCAKSRSTGRAWRRASSTTTPGARSIFSRPKW